MKKILAISTLSLAFLLHVCQYGFASGPAEGPACEWPAVGKIAPRAAAQIKSSPWSVGGETLDRDFAVFAYYKQYLGPLGAKGLRVQTGWAKTERQPGQYQWEWLDEVVNGALSQGVQPWLELSYGNPIYPGGGGTGLGGGLPTSAEALTAWDRWTRALVQRYRDRVNQWEVWNEPDIGKNNKPEEYANLFVRTAEIIRAEQPEGKIFALGLAGDVKFAEQFLDAMKQRGKVDLIDAITVHGYPANPDDISLIVAMRKLAAKYSPRIEIRQGETGAPSTSNTFGALRNRPWSELTQAKWNLRRMLAHRAADVPFNLFTLMELAYRNGEKVTLNTKGLLKSNPDQTVAYPKPAYFAAQHVFAIFDDSWTRVAEAPYKIDTNQKVALTVYQQGDGGPKLVAYWLSAAPPSEKNVATAVQLTLPGVNFEHPVLADLLSGRVYQIPKAKIARSEEGISIHQLPIYDAPLIISERAALPIAAD